MKRYRVLVVDDSLFMRAAVAKTLASGTFEVVGQAKDGKEPHSGYASLHNSLQEAIGQWRVFKQSRSEMTWRNIVSYYNNAIGTFNRGFGR